MTTSQINPSQLRPPQPPHPNEGGRLVHVPSERRSEAIERLLAGPTGASGGSGGERGPVRRFLEYAAANRINLEHMWARLEADGRLTETVLAVPSPGRTAMVFASRAANPVAAARIGALLAHACEAIAAVGVELAQALLEPEERTQQQAFWAGGFTTLATLSYMERPVRTSRRPPPPPDWPAGVSVESHQSSLDRDFAAALDASYEGTLDCPQLRGLRRTEDIMAGHRAAGRFEPALWTLLRVEGRPAGALLLNPASDGMAIELVYLGLAAWARGRGLGVRLLRHGLRLLHSRAERSIHLAVDETNVPAVSLYRREGFAPALRRLAMIRPSRAER